MSADELPVLAFESQADWAAWLAEHGADTPGGIWLKFAKKDSGIRSVVYAEALQEALRQGWIDGQARSFDDDCYLQRFTPRRPRSKWSQRNVDYAEALIADGRMLPAGLAEVERAKADGRWEAAYPGPATATAPPDLQAALDADPEAAAFFATLSSTNRYAIIYQVLDAKRPETRERRIAKYVAMCAAGETVR